MPGMRAGIARSLPHQANIQSLVAGILRKFPIAPQYEHDYIVFAYALDRIARRGAGSPGRTNEIDELVGDWSCRGRNPFALDAISDAIAPRPSPRTFDLGLVPTLLSINSLSGHVAIRDVSSSSISVYDPVKRTFHTVALNFPATGPHAWCPEASIIALSCVYTSPLITRIWESDWSCEDAFASTGDMLQTPAADYDVSLYGTTHKGWFFFPNNGHFNLIAEHIDGAPGAATIPTPDVTNHAVVDQETNSVWCTALGSAQIFRIDRSSFAVTAIALPWIPGQIALDTNHGTLWIASAGTAKALVQMDTSTHALNTPVVLQDFNEPIVCDPVRYRCYCAQQTPGNIKIVDGATSSIESLPSTVNTSQLAIDPAAGILYALDDYAGTVTRYWIANLTVPRELRTITAPGAYRIAADTFYHRLYISEVAPTPQILYLAP
jgi:DNA-binding beta-propeller fold protein YncE